MSDPAAVQTYFFQEIQAGEEKLALGKRTHTNPWFSNDII